MNPLKKLLDPILRAIYYAVGVEKLFVLMIRIGIKAKNVRKDANFSIEGITSVVLVVEGSSMK
jgi:hypothetical protein